MISLTRRQCLAAGTALALGTVVSHPLFAKDLGRVAIVYFSRTGTVHTMAQAVAARTGAQVFRIDVKEPYAADYSDMTDIARDEVRRNARRELSTTVGDLSGFDTIFIGSPYWWGSISVPMNTFLMDHDLAGKQVYPFIASASSPADGAINRIKTLCPKAMIGKELHVTGSDAGNLEKLVNDWIDQIKAS